MKPAIRVENLSKQYTIGQQSAKGSYRTLRDTVTDAVMAPFRMWNGQQAPTSEPFWALKDVSFEVMPGEVVGIIGRNGAGKSTLLKILSRITEPTSGRIEVRGRMGSLLEVGTGFHPELTGRENIYLNGSILGMSKREIDRKFDEIVAFSEIEKFLDTPVKRYSSGMYVRLAFAVAAHLEPEILIVDEVLAVGDAAFQKKCLGQMEELANAGRTIFLVSHNMHAIITLCTQAIYLQKGILKLKGDCSSAIDAYLGTGLTQISQCNQSLDYYRRGNTIEAGLKISSVTAKTQPGNQPSRTFDICESIDLSIEVESTSELHNLSLVIFLAKKDIGNIGVLYNHDSQFRLDVRPGLNVVNVNLGPNNLAPGEYLASVHIGRHVRTKSYDVIVDYPIFEVRSNDSEKGGVDWDDRPWGAIVWPSVQWSDGGCTK